MGEKSFREQTYDALREEIRANRGGGRLPSIRELAQRLGTSFSTVKSAVAQLEAEGLVERRHGSGTYITGKYGPMRMSDAAVLCMHSFGHVWGDLCQMFVSEFQSRHRIVSLIDWNGENLRSTILRAAQGGVRTFVAHVNVDFPVDVFRQCSDRDSLNVIGVATWESQAILPNLHRVLTDYEAGGCMVAEHMHRLGHERAVMIYSRQRLEWFRQGNRILAELPMGFAGAFKAMGGKWDLVMAEMKPGATLEEGVCVVNEQDFLDAVSGPNGATAVFGLRDVEACAAAQIIRDRLPEKAGQIAIAGYFDTPWSQSAQPAITSVNLNIPRIVSETMRILDALQAGERPACSLVKIPPRLVVRQSSCRRRC